MAKDVDTLKTATAVKKGVEWLNKVMPNWRSVVDWDRLNMQDSAKCILGQTRGYRDTLREHGHNGGRWAEEHGFFTPAKGESTKAKYHELELMWQKMAGNYQHENY